MPQYDYRIGTTLVGMVNVESLTTPVNPPIGEFTPWSIEQDGGDGQVAGHGWPKAIWRFSILTKAMVAQLRTFCPGASATVYIRTRIQGDTFSSFSAVMKWPSMEEMRRRNAGDKYLDLEFEFRRLQAA